MEIKNYCLPYELANARRQRLHKRTSRGRDTVKAGGFFFCRRLFCKLMTFANTVVCQAIYYIAGDTAEQWRLKNAEKSHSVEKIRISFQFFFIPNFFFVCVFISNYSCVPGTD